MPPRQRHSGRTLRASPRRWDGVLRSPEPATDAVRRVKSNGLIRWHGVLVYISEALGGEPVGSTRATTASGRSATARSCSVSSPTVATR